MTTTIQEPQAPIVNVLVEVRPRIAAAPPAGSLRAGFPDYPEIPAEFLRPRDAVSRSSWRSAVVAACLRAGEAVLGPPLTDQARMQREIAVASSIQDRLLMPGF